MKKIAILSPDPIRSNNSLLDLTKSGERALKFAEYLSNNEDFNISLFLPNKETNRVFESDKYDVIYYSFNAANYNWSQELDKKLKTYDFVIIQSVSGVGFYNCAVLPNHVNVIVDGWIPYITKLPMELLSKHKVQRKFEWDRFLPHYQNLMKRANCVLYANDRQHYFYEGQFFMINKLGWKAYKFSPMHKVPFGVEKQEKLELNSSIKKLLWYGDIHQYDAVENLINTIGSSIKLDFLLPHDKLYASKYRKVIDKISGKISNHSNINIIRKDANVINDLNFREILKEYDAGVYFSHNWIEDKYAHNNNVLKLLSYGLPVITKSSDNVFLGYELLSANGLYNMKENEAIENLLSDIDLKFSKESFEKLHNILSWDKILHPMIEYIRRF